MPYGADLQKKELKKICAVEKNSILLLITLKIYSSMNANVIGKFFVFVIFCLSVGNAFSASMEFGGVYYEQNAYIKNPSLSSGFCIKGITLNGKKIDTNLNTGLVVVNFSANGLRSGDAFNVLIDYDESDVPVITQKHFLQNQHLK